MSEEIKKEAICSCTNKHLPLPNGWIFTDPGCKIHGITQYGCSKHAEEMAQGEGRTKKRNNAPRRNPTPEMIDFDEWDVVRGRLH